MPANPFIPSQFGLAVRRPLIEAFNFRLSIDGLGVTDFAKVSQLQMSFGVNKYREGGATLTVKDPDLLEVEDISLERGVSFSEEVYAWILSISQQLMGATLGLPVRIDKRNATLYEYTRDKQIAKRIQIYGAFPTMFVAGEWNNFEDQVLIEKLTLAYDFFEIIS